MTLQAHIDNQDNPHGLTLSQLGFTNLRTWPLATPEEIIAMERDDCYIDILHASDNVRTAFNDYVYTLGLADENGNIFPPARDLEDVIQTFVNFEERLRIQGFVEGGRELTYTVFEDGTSYLTGTHDFVDTFNFTVEGVFREDRNYTTLIVVANENSHPLGSVEQEVEDRREVIDLSDGFDAIIDSSDRLRLRGDVQGGRSLRYEVSEDGIPFLTGTHDFEDTYDFFVEGNFVATSTYQVAVTITNNIGNTIAVGERVIDDIREEKGGYFWTDESGTLWYDQRHFSNWMNVTEYDILDYGVLGG